MTTRKQDYYVNVVNETPIPVTLGSENITINGDVNVLDTVTVNNPADNPVHTHIVEVGTSGLLETPYMPVGGTITADQGTNPWLVSNIMNHDIDNAPWQLQVAMGKVTGVTGLSISGYSGTVGTTFIPAWELNTAYTYFPSAQQVRVWSSSASDTDVSIKVDGLNSLYDPISETVVLNNGTTGVLTTANFLRVNSISLTRVPQNVGLVRAGSSDKTITLAVVGQVTNVTSGRSQMSVYTVPAGYTFFLTQSNWYTNQVGSQTAMYRSYTKSPTGLATIVLTFPMQQQYNSVKVVPRAYAEKTDIQWQVASSQGDSAIGGQIEGYLISNSLLT